MSAFGSLREGLSAWGHGGVHPRPGRAGSGTSLQAPNPSESSATAQTPEHCDAARHGSLKGSLIKEGLTRVTPLQARDLPLQEEPSILRQTLTEYFAALGEVARTVARRHWGHARTLRVRRT